MTYVLLLVTLHVSVFAMMFQTSCTVGSSSAVEEVEDAFDFELNFSVNGVVPKKMNQVPVPLFRSDRHCFLGVKKPGLLEIVNCQSSKLAFDGSFNLQLVGGSDGPLMTFMNEPSCCTVVRIVASRISMKHQTGTSGDCRLASALVITLSSVDIAVFIYEVGRNKGQGSQMSKRCRSGSQLDPFLQNVFMECSQHRELRVFYCLCADCL